MIVTSPGDEQILAALAHYDEFGYARLGRVLSDEGLSRLRDRADALMLGKVTWPGLFFQHDAETGRYEDLPRGVGYQGPSLAYRKLEKLEKDPLYREWIENPIFERIVRARIAGDIAIYRAILMTKPATGGTPLPWHQDGGTFWGLERDPELQIWTALDDASLNAGCVEVLPGSHHGGIATPLGGVIPDARIADQRANERAVPIAAKAGEALLIHNYVWHRSGTNSTGLTRRAFSICYMSASVRCVRKKKAPREFVRVFDHRGVST